MRRVSLTRREFLNDAWLASLGFIFVAGFGSATFFAFPRFKEGQFGGTFIITPQDLPALTDEPKPYGNALGPIAPNSPYMTQAQFIQKLEALIAQK